MQLCIDALEIAKNNADDVHDALEEEFDTGLDDDIIGCNDNSISELGFAIEQFEVIFNRTPEAGAKMTQRVVTGRKHILNVEGKA